MLAARPENQSQSFHAVARSRVGRLRGQFSPAGLRSGHASGRGCWAVDAQAASATQMGRFKTETRALPKNRSAMAYLNGMWIDHFHDRNGLDMDSSVSSTHGDREGTA